MPFTEIGYGTVRVVREDEEFPIDAIITKKPKKKDMSNEFNKWQEIVNPSKEDSEWEGVITGSSYAGSYGSAIITPKKPNYTSWWSKLTHVGS